LPAAIITMANCIGQSPLNTLTCSINLMLNLKNLDAQPRRRFRLQ
jgi:hypothetical protein